VAAPPLDLPYDGPVTYPGDTKIPIKSSKGRSRPTLKIRNSQINNGRKVYALNAHPTTFLLIYLEMKKKKCGRSCIFL